MGRHQHSRVIGHRQVTDAYHAQLARSRNGQLANILSPRAQDVRTEDKEPAVVAQASTERISLVRPEPSWATAQAITAVAQDLAGEFSLRPLLERILLHCTELLGCDAGSICSVDEPQAPIARRPTSASGASRGRFFL
jgi:hypothetical protein